MDDKKNIKEKENEDELTGIIFADIKLTESKTDTLWTPSPKDSIDELEEFSTTEEMNSAIQKNADGVKFDISKELSNYASITNMQTAIDVSAEGITTKISEQIDKGEKTIKTSKLQMDTNGLTITNGGIRIIDNNNKNVLFCDDNGNILYQGTIVQHVQGNITIRIRNNTIDFYSPIQQNHPVGHLFTRDSMAKPMRFHTVLEGETLDDIINYYNMTYESLTTLNDMNDTDRKRKAGRYLPQKYNQLQPYDPQTNPNRNMNFQYRGDIIKCLDNRQGVVLAHGPKDLLSIATRIDDPYISDETKEHGKFYSQVEFYDEKISVYSPIDFYDTKSIRIEDSRIDFYTPWCKNARVGSLYASNINAEDAKEASKTPDGFVITHMHEAPIYIGLTKSNEDPLLNQQMKITNEEIFTYNPLAAAQIKSIPETDNSLMLSSHTGQIHCKNSQDDDWLPVYCAGFVQRPCSEEYKGGIEKLESNEDPYALLDNTDFYTYYINSDNSKSKKLPAYNKIYKTVSPIIGDEYKVSELFLSRNAQTGKKEGIDMSNLICVTAAHTKKLKHDFDNTINILKDEITSLKDEIAILKNELKILKGV